MSELGIHQALKRYGGNMDEFGRIVWREVSKKLSERGVLNPLQFVCENVISLNEKTFKRRLADHRLWLLEELKQLQGFLQSETLKNEIINLIDNKK